LKKGVSVLSVALLALLILSSGIAVYFYLDSAEANRRYNSLLSELESITLEANLLIDYGNGTQIWHNKTLFPVGATLLNATLKVSCSVEYIGSDMGIFVTGIDGVGTKIVKKGHYWLWWRFDKAQGEWVLGETATDRYILQRGDTLAWVYEDTSTYPNVRKPSER
jgi:hypothetical protein